jgi:hypothetical protein
MTRVSPTCLLWLIAILVVAAGTAVVIPFRSSTSQAVHKARFQQLVGGLGFGPTVELSTCAVQFDPRLETTCNSAVGPIPAGSLLCPGCGRFLFSFSSRSPDRLTGRSNNQNVVVP